MLVMRLVMTRSTEVVMVITVSDEVGDDEDY
jgi:hypothetical protein